MKVLFAIVQAIILGIIAWIIFDSRVNHYRDLARAEPIPLSQKYFEDTSKNYTADNGRKKYESIEEALEDAELDITIGKKIQATSEMKLGSKRVMIIVALSILGFIGWFIAYYVVYITSYPLQIVLDSIWGNFVRFFLGPTTVVSIFGGVIAFYWTDHMIRSLDVSPTISLNADATSSGISITIAEIETTLPVEPVKPKFNHEVELEREKTRIQATSVPSPRAIEPTIEDGEIFVTSITKNDVSNSKGIQITDPVLILIQDRANVHRFGNPDGDPVDQFFSLADNRARISDYLFRGSFPQDVRTAISYGNGQKFRVRIYKDNKDKNCVDVNFAN